MYTIDKCAHMRETERILCHIYCNKMRAYAFYGIQPLWEETRRPRAEDSGRHFSCDVAVAVAAAARAVIRHGDRCLSLFLSFFHPSVNRR